MKTKITFSIICLSILLFVISCTKEVNPPTITTSEIKDINNISATIGGNIVADGGGAITERGIFWGTLSDPEKNGTKIVIGSGSGSFSYPLTGLTPNTVYYVIAFASNSAGISYGVSLSFTTNGDLPAVTTNEVSVFTPTSATVGGNVTSNGNVAVTENGVYWGTSQNPETSGNKLAIGTGSGVFSGNLTGLISNTTYYVKAFATNKIGTAFGTQVSFTTGSELPTVTTNAITVFTSSSATVGGNVTVNGNVTVTERGVFWGTSQNPETSGTKLAIGTGNGTFSGNLSGLSSNTTYFVKAYATSSKGTAYGAQVSFTTSAAKILFLDNNNKVLKINVTAGQLVEIRVSNSLYSQDLSPSSNDPFLLGVFGVSNGQDGSEIVGKIFKGTNYYNSTAETWSFVANSTTNKIWVVAFGTEQTDNLHGKFDLVVNGVSYEVLPSNLIFLMNQNETREFTYTGSTVSAEISNSIVSIDPEGASKEDPFLFAMFGVSNGQDGSEMLGGIFQGTNYFHSAPDVWSYTSNSITNKVWTIPIGLTPTTNLSRKFELKLNNVHYDILP
jgi:hypothetical protein